MKILSDVINNGGGTYNQDGTEADHSQGYYVGGVQETIIDIDKLQSLKDVTIDHIIKDFLDFTVMSIVRTK